MTVIHLYLSRLCSLAAGKELRSPQTNLPMGATMTPIVMVRRLVLEYREEKLRQLRSEGLLGL